MQHRMMARPPQNGSAQKHLHAQSGRLVVSGHATGSRNSASKLDSIRTHRKAASVAKNSRRQKSSAAKSDFSSSMRCSTQTR